MNRRCLRRDEERAADLRVAESARDKRGNLEFACGELTRRHPRAAAVHPMPQRLQFVDAPTAPLRQEPTGVVDVHPRLVDVTECEQALRESDSDLGVDDRTRPPAWPVKRRPVMLDGARVVARRGRNRCENVQRPAGVLVAHCSVRACEHGLENLCRAFRRNARPHGRYQA